jgi:hypothetical protein
MEVAMGFWQKLFGQEISYEKFVAEWTMACRSADRQHMERVLGKQVKCTFCGAVVKAVTASAGGADMACPVCKTWWLKARPR